MEVWKDIKECPGYAVSNLGRFYSYRTDKYLKLGKSNYKEDGSAYPRVYFYVDGKSVTKNATRLVAYYHTENPKGLNEVNHLDGNKFNIDSSNLEWTTHSNNIKHAYATGLKLPSNQPKGEKAHASKLTDEQLEYVRNNYIPRHPQFGTRGLGRTLGVSNTQISRIVNNKSRKNCP